MSLELCGFDSGGQQLQFQVVKLRRNFPGFIYHHKILKIGKTCQGVGEPSHVPLKMRLNLLYIFILPTLNKLEISLIERSFHCFNRLCQIIINIGEVGLLPED